MSALYWLYEILTRSDPPKPADLIFVFAGRMERKQYAIELYRAGIAPRLLLSIGRFEVSKMAAIGFESMDQLIALRNRTPPEKRHFFCEMDASGSRIHVPRLARCSTYGEVLALREFLGRDTPRSIDLISTDVHLRRIAIAFRRVFRGVPIEVRYLPVPRASSSLTKEKWWSRAGDRSYVAKELAKLVGYRTILSMPDSMVRVLMRLK